MANIPVNENDRVITVAATSDGQVDFDFDFLAFTGDQVSAQHIRLSDGVETDLVFATDFSISGLSNPNGGTITLNTVSSVIGDKVLMYGDTTIQRLADFQQSGDFLANTVNTEEDLQTMMMQEMQRDISRSLKVPLGESVSGVSVPVSLAGSTIIGRADGLGYEVGPTANEITNAQGYAEASALNAAVALATYSTFMSRAEHEAATIPAAVIRTQQITNGQIVTFVADATGTALTTADGRRWSPDGDVNFYHFAGSVTTTKSDNIAIQKAITWIDSKGGGVLHLPFGDFGIDGAIGAVDDFEVNFGGGLRLLKGVVIQGVNRFVTVLKNISTEWRSVVGVRGAQGVGLVDLCIDGGWPTLAPHPTDSKRGEGVIAWNDDDILQSAIFKRLLIKNTGHYGLGLQNVAKEGIVIDDIIFENVGGDGIDVKCFDTILGVPVIADRQTSISNIWVKSYQQNPDHDDQTGVDLRGPIFARNIRVEDTWDLKAGQTAKNGIRFNGDVISNDRLGGHKSTLSGFFVGSTKPNGDGNSSTEEIIGVDISAEGVHVSQGEVENQFIGYRWGAAGDSDPVGGSGFGLIARNCKGAAGDGTGFDFGTTTRNVSGLGLLAVDCDDGYDMRGNQNILEGIARSCTLGITHNASKNNTLKIVTDNCTTRSVDTSGLYDEAANLFTETTAVKRTRRSMFDVVAIADDSSWTGDNAVLGGFRFFKSDTSGGSEGLFGELTMRATSSTGGNFTMWLSVQDGAGNMVDVLEYRPDRIRAKVPIEPAVYSVATLPTGGVSSGAMAYCTNGDAGAPCMVMFLAGAWKVISLGATAST